MAVKCQESWINVIRRHYYITISYLMLHISCWEQVCNVTGLVYYDPEAPALQLLFVIMYFLKYSTSVEVFIYHCQAFQLIPFL